MSQLVDEDGNVYEQGFGGNWQQKQGLFGPEKDTGMFGQPNVERDILGNPVPESTFLGGQILGADGRPLYRPSSSRTASSSSSSDAAAGLLALILVAGVVMLAGLVLAALFKLLAALIHAWHDLVVRYPRAMRVIHLTLGMVAVGLGLSLIGFDLPAQLGGAALVPLLWFWLWLTRRLPLIFLPINAALLGGALWLIGEWSRPLWLPIWPSLTAGLPAFTSNLSLMLAVLPLVLLLLAAGSHRWPMLFKPLIYLAIGGVAWFMLMRVWTGWQPFWTLALAPLPLLPPAGWLILFAPLVLWLWFKGQQRWPTVFFGFNLLVFGGLLGLTAYHLQPAWINTWHTWTAGLPVYGAPFLVISLAPFTAWSWNRVSHRWPRTFVVPNLLITGGILWLILDRTRPFWMPQFRVIWGDAFIGFDITLIALALPLALWLWQRGNRRWPLVWSALYALMLGIALGWVAERTRVAWEGNWQRFLVADSAYLPLMIGLMPPLLWLRAQLRKRWPLAITLISVVAISAGMFWLMGQLLPSTTYALRALVAALPLAVAGWGFLLHHQPRWGWALTLLLVTAAGLAIWLAPGPMSALASNALGWLAEQGVPLAALNQ
jgi:hypothetical protein